MISNIKNSASIAKAGAFAAKTRLSELKTKVIGETQVIGATKEKINQVYDKLPEFPIKKVIGAPAKREYNADFLETKMEEIQVS